jgi:hypothetical protein
VAVIGARHGALFLADGTIFPVQLGRLRLAEVAFLDLLMDALVLVLETVVDLLAARMILLPLRVGHGVAHQAAERKCYGCDGQRDTY